MLLGGQLFFSYPSGVAVVTVPGGNMALTSQRVRLLEMGKLSVKSFLECKQTFLLGGLE